MEISNPEPTLNDLSLGLEQEKTTISSILQRITPIQFVLSTMDTSTNIGTLTVQSKMYTDDFETVNGYIHNLRVDGINIMGGGNLNTCEIIGGNTGTIPITGYSYPYIGSFPPLPIGVYLVKLYLRISSTSSIPQNLNTSSNYIQWTLLNTDNYIDPALITSSQGFCQSFTNRGITISNGKIITIVGSPQILNITKNKEIYYLRVTGFNVSSYILIDGTYIEYIKIN